MLELGLSTFYPGLGVLYRTEGYEWYLDSHRWNNRKNQSSVLVMYFLVSFAEPKYFIASAPANVAPGYFFSSGSGICIFNISKRTRYAWVDQISQRTFFLWMLKRWLSKTNSKCGLKCVLLNWLLLEYILMNIDWSLFHMNKRLAKRHSCLFNDMLKITFNSLEE